MSSNDKKLKEKRLQREKKITNTNNITILKIFGSTTFFD